MRDDIRPILDVLNGKRSSLSLSSSSQEHFQEVANDFAAKHLTELDYDVQQDLMEAISKLHRGRKIPDPKGLLRKLMRERQNISGSAGQMLADHAHDWLDGSCSRPSG